MGARNGSTRVGGESLRCLHVWEMSWDDEARRSASISVGATMLLAGDWCDSALDQAILSAPGASDLPPLSAACWLPPCCAAWRRFQSAFEDSPSAV
jgi:hypothetical protein